MTEGPPQDTGDGCSSYVASTIASPNLNLRNRLCSYRGLGNRNLLRLRLPQSRRWSRTNTRKAHISSGAERETRQRIPTIPARTTAARIVYNASDRFLWCYLDPWTGLPFRRIDRAAFVL